AVRWLRKNASGYRIDARRIVAAGNSAGAVVALAANFRPKDEGSSGNPGFSSAVQAAVSMSGAEAPQAIGPLAPPIIMFHGTTDTTVPYPLALLTCGTTLALGNICSMHSYPLTAHGLSGHAPQMFELSAAF